MATTIVGFTLLFPSSYIVGLENLFLNSICNYAKD